MGEIENYFSSKMEYAKKLCAGPVYRKDNKEFYEKFIKEHAEELFITKKQNVLKWCELIEKYLQEPYPIYWIRKFESGGTDVNDNRRTALTFLVDQNNDLQAAYVYISNFDAQEFYNMVLNIDNPSLQEFIDLMESGKYKFHYSDGCAEKQISAYDKLENAESYGVINRANMYFAHIHDTNGKYTAGNLKFDKGNISDWKDISDWKNYNSIPWNYNFSNTTKVRIKETDLNKTDLDKELKARFLRFISPFNYFLVLGMNYEVNGIYGKSNISIGEDGDLRDYVQYRIYEDYIKNDNGLKSYFDDFEDKILIDDSEKVNEKAKTGKDLGKKDIHIVYGTSIGKDGKNLKKIQKHFKSSVDNLYQKWENGKVGAKIDFRDQKGNLIGEYRPKKNYNYSDFLDKIASKIGDFLKSGKLGDDEEIDIDIACNNANNKNVRKQKTKSNLQNQNVSGGGAVKSASSKQTNRTSIKYSDGVRLSAAEYFMRNDTSLIEIEKKILQVKTDRHGSTAKYILDAMGVTNDKKNILSKRTISDELTVASGKYKETLEKLQLKISCNKPI